MAYLSLRRTSAAQARRGESVTASEIPKPKSARERLGSAYAQCFGSPRYRRINDLLLYLSLRGLGVENYRNHAISGEEHFLRSLLPSFGKPPVILDVGAYHGEYAKIVRRYSPTAVIYCFEPHPRSFHALQQVAHDYAFKALPLACGERNGPAHLFDLAAEDGSKVASLYQETLQVSGRVPLTAHNTRVVTIDQFAKGRGIDEVQLLKIDAEGAELDVLKGAKTLIEEGRVKAIQFEIGGTNVVREVWMRDFYRVLPGYSFYRLLPRGLLPLGEYRPTTHEVFRFQNIVALLETPGEGGGEAY
jgi:FkbM family methyltransferase